MVHFLIPGISRPYLHFPLKAPNEENQDYYHKVVIRLHRVCARGPLIQRGCDTVFGKETMTSSLFSGDTALHFAEN